ncbi:MAG: hypothetical protein IT368_17545 [Candidatus Hydrogenedentes bacterium]|nr:hypothetical protein [Candidatus Hydrogenedentota bacterium]
MNAETHPSGASHKRPAAVAAQAQLVAVLPALMAQDESPPEPVSSTCYANPDFGEVGLPVRRLRRSRQASHLISVQGSGRRTMRI